MRLFANQVEPGSLINATRGDQYIVCPQRNRAIAGSAGETDTFINEPATNTQPSGSRLDIEQAQLGDLFAVLDQQHRADDCAVTLGNPTTLSPAVEIFDEGRSDLCNQCLEGLVPAIFLGIEHTVPMDDPTHVAWLMRSQDIGRRAGFLAASEQILDRRERRSQAILIHAAQRAQ